MKLERHSKIVELIGKYEIETQEELADYLNQAGFAVTQATVSRDIRELKLTKVQSESGKQRYLLFLLVAEGLDRIGVGHFEAVIGACGKGNSQSAQDGCHIDEGIKIGSIGEIPEPDMDEINRARYDNERSNTDKDKYLPKEDKYDMGGRGSVHFTDGDFLSPADGVEGG